MASPTDALRERFGAALKENEPLAKHLNFRIGGPARWFVEAKTEADVMDAVRLAGEHDVRLFVLGGGSNVLASDAGFDGLVVKIALRAFAIDGTTVRAEAGVLSVALARATAAAGLEGLEWMISLPGTIGGAVYGNAGCFGGETKDRLVSVRVLRGGRVEDIPVAPADFGYRTSPFKNTDDVILAAVFQLQTGDAAALKEKMDAQLAARKASQPTNAGSAGCAFKNPPGHSAGALVDDAGLKGMRIGDAQISPVHGNFILNLGQATADQVVQLIAVAKTRVRNQFGVQLEEEVRYIGFG